MNVHITGNKTIKTNPSRPKYRALLNALTLCLLKRDPHTRYEIKNDTDSGCYSPGTQNSPDFMVGEGNLSASSAGVSTGTVDESEGFPCQEKQNEVTSHVTLS